MLNGNLAMYSKSEIEYAERYVIHILEALAKTKMQLLKTICPFEPNRYMLIDSLNETGYKFELEGNIFTIEAN